MTPKLPSTKKIQILLDWIEGSYSRSNQVPHYRVRHSTTRWSHDSHSTTSRLRLVRLILSRLVKCLNQAWQISRKHYWQQCRAHVIIYRLQHTEATIAVVNSVQSDLHPTAYNTNSVSNPDYAGLNICQWKSQLMLTGPTTEMFWC